MKTIFIFLALTVTSLSASALVFDRETIGRCHIMTFAKRGGGMGDVVHQVVLPFAFPQIDQEINRTPTGPVTLRFGVGRVVLNQNIQMMDRGRRLVTKPIVIAIEVARLAAGQKRLRVQIQMFNIFSGQLEEVRMERVNNIQDSFLYPEHAILAPDLRTAADGSIVGTGVICPLSYVGAPGF